MGQQTPIPIQKEIRGTFLPLSGEVSGTVLVTGGTRGIGKAAAIRLAQWGYDIIFTWHVSEEKAMAVVKNIQDLGGRASAIHLSLEQDDIQSRFKEIDRLSQKPLVGLVNNAAISGGRDFFMKKSSRDWEKIFQVNVFGLVSLCKAAFKRMAFSEGGTGGSIVNLSSQVASFGGNQLLAYATSKGAVNAMTIALAKEIGPEGIRVNAVSPGIIHTREDVQEDEYLDARISQIPLGRLGKPDDVGELISWLISPLSAYISGTIIPVHGGR